jgi:outer membrane murein-binding lipoprotein Lpp
MKMVAPRGLLLAPVAAVAMQQAASPIHLVLEMMQAMRQKSIEEKQAEVVKFTKLKVWCEGESGRRAAEVKENAEDVGLLAAKIQQAAARIHKLTARVEELDIDVGRWEQDQQAASTVRDREKADYQATSRDYMDTMGAIDQAIEVLKNQDHDREQAEEALVQLRTSHLVPEHVKRAVKSFLQQPEELAVSAPEANAYEFQSGGIVDILEKLKDDFNKKSSELNKEEQKAEMAFESMMQTLKINIEAAKQEIEKRTNGKEMTAQEKAANEGQLTEAQTAHDENSVYLKDLRNLCLSKSQDFEKRQKLRKEEIDALSKAIEIVGSDDVAGAGEKHLPSLIQVGRSQAGRSQAQLRSTGSSVSPIQQRVAQLLSQRATQFNSQLLSLVAQHVSADPFDKVKKMIKDLISKLMHEATSEVEHKGWCDTELVTNEQTRTSKAADVEELSATVEELNALIAKLGQEITDLSTALSDLAAAKAEAIQDRADAKAENEATLEESKAAQLAVQKAIMVLKEYYAKAAENTSLSQVASNGPADDAPETGNEAFTGQQTQGSNVIDFLEVIESDFARLEADTSTAESMQQTAHDSFLFETEKDEALKQNEVELKSNRKIGKESELHSTEGELKTAQEQLDKAKSYYEKLKPTCVDSGITYEERVQRREAEMQSLQEALQILTGDY